MISRRRGRSRLRSVAIAALALGSTSLLTGCGGGHRASVSLTTPSRPGTTAQPGTPAQPVSRAALWRPGLGLSWQWQLSGTVDTSVDAAVYDIDGLGADPTTVAALHAQGRKVICYLDIGAAESYRPDLAAMPASVLGKTVEGWPQERYLDIRRIDIIGPVMARRLDTCQAKGFDAVEGDMVDAFSNDSGFPITAHDEIGFLRWFAEQAHARGLSTGLKNDPELVGTLSSTFDFAIVEDCFNTSSCDAYTPLVKSGEAVFDAEYQVDPAQFCPAARPLGISAIAKHQALDAWRRTC